MKTSSEEILEKFLRYLEKERKRVWISNGIVEFAFVSFASLGLASLLAHIYSNNIYFSVLKVFIILALCYGFVKFIVSPILKREEKAKLAIELEKISPGLGEDTLNALLLLSDLTTNDKELGVSKFLTEAHVNEVTSKLESIDLSPAIPSEKIKTYWRPLAAILALSTTMLILAPKGFQSLLFSANVLPPSEPNLLELADIEVEHTYPAYTKLSSQVVKGSTGDVKAITGTHVTFKAIPIKKLVKGELVIENGLVTSVSSDGERINGEFTILSNGSFFIQDKNGEQRSRIFKITAENDKNPKVSIDSPSDKVIEIEDEENLDILYKADDDFGLKKLLLTFKTKRGESSRSIGQIKEEPKSLEGKFTWDFSGVESEPEEIIEAMIQAYDNDTVSGPKVGVSNVIKVKLNDPRKRHKNILVSVENLLDQFLDTLADEIENRPWDNKNINRTKVIQDGISSKIEKVIDTLNEILERIKDDDFSNYTYFLGLSNMKIGTEDLLNERRDLLTSLSLSDISRLTGLITKEISEFEDNILFLDSLLKGDKLRDSLLYGRETLSKYKELSELLKNLKQNENEETRKEVEKKIEEIRGLISQLTKTLGSINLDIPDGYLNPDAFNSLDLEGKLDEIMNLIKEGQIDKALEMLASLGENLQEMVASLESGFQSYSSASLSKEMTELNNIISNIEGLEEGEKSLKEKTEKLKSSLLKDPSSKGNLNKFVEREKKKIETLKNLLIETRSKLFPNFEKNELVEGSILVDRILYEIDELKHWLESFEFNEALLQAKDVEEQTIGLRNLSDLRLGKIASASLEVENSAELAREIREDLEELSRQGGKKEIMRDLVQKQDSIKKDTSKLIGKISGLSEEKLILPPKIGEKLLESKGFMQGASNNLKDIEISKALSNQDEAIKALKQAREEAKGLLEKYQLSAKGMGIPAPFLMGREEFKEGIHGVDTSYVEIPSAEESKEGREFKESLLKSLKEGSPEGFSELNKNYYERIIK